MCTSHREDYGTYNRVLMAVPYQSILLDVGFQAGDSHLCFIDHRFFKRQVTGKGLGVDSWRGTPNEETRRKTAHGMPKPRLDFSHSASH